MGQTLGTGDKKSVNVELNIVPFIDLMSCLTAFLLVTAVWVNIANVKNEPVNQGPDPKPQGEPPPRLTVLLEDDQILVQQMPTGEARKLPAFDWTSLESTLREFKTPGETPTVEVAAASTNAHPIEYQKLIVAMDTAVRAGYPHVGVTDPMTLAR
ncbi:MAG TPA: biopolymer transporter ExbD [Kofleriaceae bacterium]|nr:biopolymer transporter ExbD [Kofleriaceae bacterium]